MIVIKSLENRGILFKGTTTKITSQEGGFLNFLRLLTTVDLTLIKTALFLLAKSVLIPLGLSSGMSAAYAATQKKIYGSGRASRTTALIISTKELEDVMKIVKSNEEAGLLIKGISETIKNEAKEQGGFLPILLGALATSILANALAGKGVIRAGKRESNNKSRSKLLMPPHPLTNFETQKYYQNEPKFNGVYSRNSLSKIKY